MPAPPADAAAHLASGYRPVSRVEVVNADTGAVTVVPGEGTVTVDLDAQVRRRLDMTVPFSVAVSPPHRVRVWSGFAAGDGEWLAPLGEFRVTDTERQDRATSRVVGFSAEILVRRDRFPRPRLVEGPSRIDTIRQLVSEADPMAVFRVETDADAALPHGGVVYDRERLEAVFGREESVATSLGLDVAPGPDGVWVIRDAPNLGDDPVWSVRTGVDGVRTSLREALTDESVVNAWVAYTDSPDQDAPQFRAEAVDDDPYSPTRVQRWGVHRQFLASPMFTDAWQCQRAADAQLAKSKGLAAAVSFGAVRNPWLDVGDVVLVEGWDGGLTRHLIERVRHGFGRVGEGVQADTRSVNVEVLA